MESQVEELILIFQSHNGFWWTHSFVGLPVMCAAQENLDLYVHETESQRKAKTSWFANVDPKELNVVQVKCQNSGTRHAPELVCLTLDL